MSQLLGLLGIVGTFAVSKVLPAVIIVVVGILAIRLLMKLVVSALEKSKLEKAAHSLIKSVLQTVLYVVLGLIVAANLGTASMKIGSMLSVYPMNIMT